MHCILLLLLSDELAIRINITTNTPVGHQSSSVQSTYRVYYSIIDNDKLKIKMSIKMVITRIIIIIIFYVITPKTCTDLARIQLIKRTLQKYKYLSMNGHNNDA